MGNLTDIDYHAFESRSEEKTRIDLFAASYTFYYFQLEEHNCSSKQS